MGFKRTTEGRVFFSGTGGVSNDETGQKIAAPLTAPDAKKSAVASATSQVQMLSLLRSLNDKLQLSQIERKSMRHELESYRGLIEKLEQKADRSDKAYQGLQAKVTADSSTVKKAEATATEAMRELQHARDLFLKVEGRAERADRFSTSLMEQAEQHKKVSLAITKKQTELERKYNEQQTMLARETTSYDDMMSRLSKTEQKQLAFEGQFQNALKQQARLVDTLDKEIESRARFMRKIDQIEETVLLTQDTINQSSANGPIEQGNGAHLPEHLAALPNAAAAKAASKPIGVAMPLMVTGAAALLLAGWGISTLQRPDLSAFQDRFEIDSIVAPITQPVTPAIPEAPAAKAPWQTSQDISDLFPEDLAPVPSAEQQADMNSTMDLDPAQIAAQLNAIEPGIVNSIEDAAPQEEIQIAKAAPTPEPEIVPAPAPVAKAPAPTPAPAPVVSFSKPNPSLPQSVKEVEALALQGIPEAQHDLAAIYVTGHAGVQQDYTRAAYWFEEAASSGIVNASYNLGVLYHQGLGVEENLETAMRWYESAAENGHPEAQYNLGIAHIEGIGVEYDPAVASMHFETAAQNGVTEAAYNLGLIYENGLLGTPKPDEALMWYKTAADAGSTEAQSALRQLTAALGITGSQIDRIVDDVRRAKNIEITLPVAPNATAPSTQKKTKPVAAIIPRSDPVSIWSPPSTPSVASAPAAAQLNPILQVQENLMRLGLYPGPADGRTGPLTQDAISTYQSMHQLNQTGQSSVELLMHMQGQI